MEHPKEMAHETVHGGDEANKGGHGAKVSLHSVGWLWSATWKQYRDRLSVLFEIVLLPMLVIVLGYVLRGLGFLFPLSILGGIVAAIGWIILFFSVLPVIFSIHHDAGADASYKATVPWFWAFVWVAIFEMVAVLGGFVMLIVPGIWLGVAFGLTAYVFAIEGRRGIDALRQSREYVKGYWWAFLGRSLLLGLAYYVVVLVVEVPAGIFAGKFGAEIVVLFLALLFIPFSAIYHYLIYQNLRALKPELAGRKAGHTGTDFVNVSTIVGLVALIIIVLGLVLFVGFGIASAWRHWEYSPRGGYGAPMQGY
jgi:hypothetical protein